MPGAFIGQKDVVAKRRSQGPGLCYDAEMLRIALIFASFQFFGVFPNVPPVDSHFVVITHDPFVKTAEPEGTTAIVARIEMNP